LIVNDFAGAPLDFADVDQHACDRINSAAENKIGDVIATGSVFRPTSFTERGEVFTFTPARDKQSARGRKFKPLADRQKHDGAILSEAKGIQTASARLP
jgi:hypothetical protein